MAKRNPHKPVQPPDVKGAVLVRTPQRTVAHAFMPKKVLAHIQMALGIPLTQPIVLGYYVESP